MTKRKDTDYINVDSLIKMPVPQDGDTWDSPFIAKVEDILDGIDNLEERVVVYDDYGMEHICSIERVKLVVN